jgi:hypothetical protein
MESHTLWVGNGAARWLGTYRMGAGAVAESGEACEARWSSVLSSVTVIGVGMSRFGSSMLALDGLLCVSVGDCSRVPCGGGVGSRCAGRRRAGSTLLLEPLFSPLWAVDVCGSSGGHVARSCSAGERTTSSGVGIVRLRGARIAIKDLLVTHRVKAQLQGQSNRTRGWSVTGLRRLRCASFR